MGKNERMTDIHIETQAKRKEKNRRERKKREKRREEKRREEEETQRKSINLRERKENDTHSPSTVNTIKKKK